jgi:hypothetical protein
VSCPPDRHAVEFYCRHPDAHGHTLPGFATRSNAFIQGKIISNHRDELECFRAVADQRSALDRTRYPAVLNQVRLGGREDELPVGYIDLTAAEVDRVETPFDALDDVFRQVVAR